jgi:hypothetical protein
MMQTMRRGPAPAKGMDLAIPVAMMRGEVTLFRYSPTNQGDFMIAENGRLTVVRLRLAARKRWTADTAGAEYASTIAGFSGYPLGGPVSIELWLYSRYGTLRFFRIGAAGLAEIDCHGEPFVNGAPASRKITGNATSSGLPGKACAGTIVPVVPPVDWSVCPGGFNGPIARWLRRWNAGKKTVMGETTGGPAQNPGERDRDLETAGKIQVSGEMTGRPVQNPGESEPETAGKKPVMGDMDAGQGQISGAGDQEPAQGTVPSAGESDAGVGSISSAGTPGAGCGTGLPDDGTLTE